MSTSKNSVQSMDNVHNDKDLIQLAGYHAYRSYKKRDEIEVNNKLFFVENVIKDPDTGFEALVVRNITPVEGDTENHDGELIIVYVGSRPDSSDWGTNIDLLKDIEPEQMKQAVEYFEKMEEKYGEISAVTGNSLGGALANRVAVEHTYVKSVTLNPAILPSEFGEVDTEYTNIVNYQIDYDILSRVLDATMEEGRIPGQKHTLFSGLPVEEAVLSNHLGYNEVDSEGNFIFEVGTEGDPGHGYIHVGADDHIASSIWTNETLYNDDDSSIELNVGDIEILADGLKSNVLNRLMLSEEYIKNAKEIVEDESNLFNSRVSELQEKINILLKEYVADPLYKGASTITSAITTPISNLSLILYFAEERLVFLNELLDSAPIEFFESVFKKDVSVESIISPIRKVLNKIIEVNENLLNGIYELVSVDLEELLKEEFEEEREVFKDAIVDELEAHYSVINENNSLIISQITAYEKQVRSVGRIFSGLDEDIGLAIATKTLPPESIETIEATSVQRITQSDYLNMKLAMKDKQVNEALVKFKQMLDTKITILLSTARIYAVTFKHLINGAINGLDKLMNVAVYNPISMGLDLVTDWIEKLKEAGAKVERKLLSFLENSETLIAGIDVATDNIPYLIENFEKDIDIAIFAPGKLRDVQLYNIASVSILTEMGMVFEDIIRHLSSNRSRAIEETINISKDISINMDILKRDIDRGTI